MDQMQWLSLLLVGALSITILWTVFVTIPGLLWTVLTVRLRGVHRQLARLLAEDSQLRELDEIQDFDAFLHSAIGNRTHFGLSGALTVLTASVFVRPDAEDDVFDDMSYTQRLAVAGLVADTLKLTFVRAFLCSSLWFVTWPFAIWAAVRFSRIDAADEDWNSATIVVPLESMRERVGGGWPANIAGSRGHHQTVG